MANLIDSNPVRSFQQISEERDATSTVVKKFFSLGQITSGLTNFYSKDQLESVRDLTDSSGNILAHYEYQMYGDVTQPLGGFASDFQYAGYYFHAPSRLNLTLNRAYNPTLGRWINRDPIEDLAFEISQEGPEQWVPQVKPNSTNPVDVVQSLNRPDTMFQTLQISPAEFRAIGPGGNLYNYCLNDPVDLSDQSGLAPPKPVRKFFAWLGCRAGCRLTAEFQYQVCIRMGRSPEICKKVKNAAYKCCVDGCMKALGY